MATLQKIRNNAGVLVAAIIGLALFSFILSDLFSSGSTLFRSTKNEIANIDGESVQITDFQKKVEELGDIYKSNSGKSQIEESDWVQIREQVWQTMLRDKILSKQYNKIGLAVTPEELFDLMQGSNPHPIIQQIFTNTETGQFDRSAVVNFLKGFEAGSLTDQQKSYWLYLERQIASDRLDAKYNNLINKSLYITGQEAKQSIDSKSKQVNMDYVALNYNIVPDSSIKVTSDELEMNYKIHKTDYKSEKTRTIEYIAYTVTPSASDYSNSEKWINEIKSDFAKTTENIQFVNSNSDVRFDGTWNKMSTLPDTLATWIFKRNASVNDIYGPYFENNSYKLAKLNEVKMLPDSVEARHILLKVNTQEDVVKVQSLADSLKNLILKGADFASLALQYSSDKGSAIQGGNVGWFKRGVMVKSFEDSAFLSNVNDVKITASQFGLHIIQTTKLGPLNKQVQVAILERTVTPSTQTYQNYYSMAGKFVGENTNKAQFDAAVMKEKLAKKMVVLHEADVTIAGLEYPRALVRAAFKAKKGSILKNSDGSPIFEMGNNFVIATLVNATEEGILPLSSVKDRVELAVQKEKKSEILAERMRKAKEGKNDLSSIAGILGSQVKTVNDINFNSQFIPDLGMEPAVIGTAVSLAQNTVSEPVKGENGVYLVKVTSVKQIDDGDLKAEKVRLAQELMYRGAANQSLEIHKKAVKVDDKRAVFY
jgi:peptidyl-prolyl cis-trans isomerase D